MKITGFFIQQIFYNRQLSLDILINPLLKTYIKL